MNARTGTQRIRDAFRRARAEHRAAVMPYLTLGYPTPRHSLSFVEAAIEGGADLLELGIPFSDPLADGPTVQRATHVALQQGMTVRRCLEIAAELRGRAITTPFLLMGYYNPILAYGEEAFCTACCEIGVDGLIVPDLPPGEADGLQQACHDRGLAQVHLLAPTSPPERVRLVTARSRGFVYLVSVTGVTGARDRLPADLSSFVERVRAETDKPLAVGFGIAGPEQAARVAAVADGVIVGSALLRQAAGPGGADRVRAFVAALRKATLRDG